MEKQFNRKMLYNSLILVGILFFPLVIIFSMNFGCGYDEKNITLASEHKDSEPISPQKNNKERIMKNSMELTESEGRILLSIARKTIENRIFEKDASELSDEEQSQNFLK